MFNNLKNKFSKVNHDILRNPLVKEIFDTSENKGIPHQHKHLPYRLIDKETGIFCNSNSLGFMLELGVLDGCSDKTIQGLHKLISNLPTGNKWHYKFNMTGNYKIGDQLEHNRKAYSTSSSNELRAKEQRDFYEMASSHGFLSGNETQSGWYDIKDYRVYVEVTYKARYKESNIQRLSEVKQEIQYSLANENMQYRTIYELEFISYIQNILNHDRHNKYYPKSSYNSYEYINKHCLCPSSQLDATNKDYIDISYDDKECRIVSLGMKNKPDIVRIYDFIDKLSSTKNPGLSLRGPFVYSVGFYLEDPVKTSQSLKSKLNNVKKNAEERVNVGVEINDYTRIQQQMDLDKDLKICWAQPILTIFTDKETYRQDIKAAQSLFDGFVVIARRQKEALQMQLPFISVDIQSTLGDIGFSHRISSFNTTNFLPLLGDWKGSDKGVLLLGSHNQLSYIDHFNLGASNSNSLIVGQSGSGKSVFLQLLMESILSQGGEIYIIDYGYSHEKYVKTRSGSHTSPTEIRCNPFINIKEDVYRELTDSEEDCQSIMAASLDGATSIIELMIDSTGVTIDNFKHKIIQNVVYETYDAKKHLATIDDLYARFCQLAKSNKSDRRYTDIPVELMPFTSKGQYGKYFIGETNLDSDIKLHCLELKGLLKDLQPIVMYSMMFFMGQQVFNGDRAVNKGIFFEEFKLYQQITNKFIINQTETYIREVRKYGGAIFTITQQLLDYFASDFVNQFYTTAGIKYILEQDESVLNDLATEGSELSKGFMPHEVAWLRSFRPAKQGFSSMLVKLSTYSSVRRLFLSPIDKILTTTEPTQLAYLRELKKEGYSLDQSIVKGALKFYPKDMKRLESYKKYKYKDAA